MRQIKIYVASKLRHANRIKAARTDGFHFNARWLNYASTVSPVTHWLEENMDDIRSSDYVLVYGEPGEHLKTAIGEAFYAMAYGKPVYVIGEHDDYKPWCYFVPRVHRSQTFEEALSSIRLEVDRRARAV